MNRPLVSVIVPAYNVDKYIEKCITSIIEQTYSNMEIIVVDDGSIDETSHIIDRMIQVDGRIMVIHQENSGVSAARNSGLDVCSGEYVVFVDGDDYLSQDYIEYMLSLVKQSHADFCFSKNSFTRKGESQIQKDCVEILTPEDATALLISPAVIVGCWNKIYKRSMILEHNLRFSADLFYGEGLSFIIAAAQVSNCVGVGCRKVYYYRRNNEQSATSQFDIAKIYNGEKALEMIGNRLVTPNKKINTMLTLHKSIFALGAIVKLKANHLESTYPEEYQRWYEYIKRHTFELVRSKDVPIYRKLMLMGGCISPWLMSILDLNRRKRIVARSVTD